MSAGTTTVASTWASGIVTAGLTRLDNCILAPRSPNASTPARTLGLVNRRGLHPIAIQAEGLQYAGKLSRG